MFGKLNDSQIEEVLTSQTMGRIGCHADDVTYVVPTSYAYHNGNIYGHTFDGMKIKMMRKNPRVCFTVDTMQNTGSWQSVITWGKFEELTDIIERNKALLILMNPKLPFVLSITTHLPADWPFVDDLSTIKMGIVFRIALDEKHGRFEKKEASPVFAG